jgi:hypothetical protein
MPVDLSDAPPVPLLSRRTQAWWGRGKINGLPLASRRHIASTAAVMCEWLWCTGAEPLGMLTTRTSTMAGTAHVHPPAACAPGRLRRSGGARLQLGRGADCGQAHGDLAHGGPVGRVGRPALAQQLAHRLQPILRQRPPVPLRDLRAVASPESGHEMKHRLSLPWPDGCVPAAARDRRKCCLQRAGAGLPCPRSGPRQRAPSPSLRQLKALGRGKV